MFKHYQCYLLLGCNLFYTLPSCAELRDPTTPTILAPSHTIQNTSNQPLVLVLSAIWLSPNKHRAVINGISVMQGESLFNNSVKVISIHRNLVIVSQNGTRKTLQLLQRPYQTQ